MSATSLYRRTLEIEGTVWQIHERSDGLFVAGNLQVALGAGLARQRPLSLRPPRRNAPSTPTNDHPPSPP